MVDGYITRFKPNLVRADGTVPPVEQVHLHHGTWLSEHDYGSGPFFAAGEEKTIAPFPRGYGMPVKHGHLAAALHGPLGRRAADGGVHHLRHRLRAEGAGRRARASSPPTRSGSTCAPPATRSSTSSAPSAAPTDLHLAEGEVRDVRPCGKQFTGQGKPGNGKGEDFGSRRGEPFGRAGVHRRHAHRHRRAPAPGRHPERDRPRREARRRGGSTPAWPATGTEPEQGRRPDDSWDFSMPVLGLPNWGVRVKPGDAAQQRDLRHDDRRRPTRTWASRSPARPRRRNGKPTAPGRRPVQGPARPLDTLLRLGGYQGEHADALRQRHGHARPLQGERQPRRPVRQVGARSSGRRPARSASPTSSTRPVTCRRSR